MLAFLVLWGGSTYNYGTAVLLHSCVDIFVIVLIASHIESYPSQCFAALSITDDIIHMDTQFPIHMVCGDNVEEVKVHYKHMDSYQG